MAKYFWYGIEYGQSAGLIKPAAPFTVAIGSTCEKTAGQAQYGGITQKGSGQSDGIYYHKSQEMGSIWSYTSEFDRDQVCATQKSNLKSQLTRDTQWFFTRLYGEQYDDLVGWWNTNGVITYATWKNVGEGKFNKVSDMTTSLFCNPKGVWWVDINGKIELSTPLVIKRIKY
jgi:hypothetical protein